MIEEVEEDGDYYDEIEAEEEKEKQMEEIIRQFSVCTL
jgi:hypothetical protein